jgi:hypothetical protein
VSLRSMFEQVYKSCQLANAGRNSHTPKNSFYRGQTKTRNACNFDIQDMFAACNTKLL